MDDLSLKQYIISTKYLKDSTKKIYLKYLDKIQEEIYPVSLSEIMHNLTEFDKRLKEFSLKTAGKIYEHLSDHSVDVYYSSLKALFTYNSILKEELYEEYKLLNRLQQEHECLINLKYESNQPTLRQKRGYIDYDDVVKICDSLYVGSIERLLILMYTELPPQRSDFGSVRIYYNKIPVDNTYENYILLSKDSKVIRLGEYKTVSTYGEIILDLPEKIQMELYVSLHDNPRNFLFITDSRGKFSRSGYNSWANRIVKRVFKNDAFSLSMFRHIYISRRDLMLESKSGVVQGELAKSMGHSISQQRRYSWHTWLENQKEDEITVPEIPLKK